ncbi:hypothetical protein HGA88_05820 [Candidatus Roizmanbacteria bacterium]|nr:hypothetical protein [Candidatus Roizmanbacteria bacterium]
MITLIVVVLGALWLLGYVNIPALPFHDFLLFTVFGRQITLYNLLTFLLIVWLIDLLPDPFRTIASVIFLLWLLAIFGIISIAGFPNLVILGLIIGVVIYLITKH